jgi:putative nucleotidyltransferase with HDIG domain
VRFSEIISALTYALDLTEGRPMGHAVRSCVLGMRVAEEMGMNVHDRGDLFYALLMKDAGCSSNSSKLFHILAADDIRAKRDVKLTDWTRVGWESLHFALTHVAAGAPFLERVRTLVRIAARQQADSRELVKIRCERGAWIARRLGLPEAAAQAIHSLDEHWNGGGYPDGLRGKEIPLFARIMNLAQTLEVFLVDGGPEAAIDAARKRSGRWFDPELVSAAGSLAKRDALWAGLEKENAIKDAIALEPEERRMTAGEETIENICQTFAEIVDAKSPFTYRHSNGVADTAVAISRQLALDEQDTTFIRRAALLHDIGKLSVSNAILEKPAALNEDEWASVKRHPYYSYDILRRVPGFEEMSETAAAHHEKLDGSGYYRHWTAERLTLPMRIIAVSDIYDALTARRPYRDALPLDRVFEIMQRDAPHAIDAQCLEALRQAAADTQSTGKSLLRLAHCAESGKDTDGQIESGENHERAGSRR